MSRRRTANTMEQACIDVAVGEIRGLSLLQTLTFSLATV